MVPKHVFLDTNVFAGQQYNFASTAFKAFTAAAAERGIELLLPDPIEKEVRRHIRDRSVEALKALHDARRAAPFLKKWAHFPKDSLGKVVDDEIARVAGNEWHRFKQQFRVRHLGYEGVDAKTVMEWYDRGLAPFGTGQKRKEFPDAFAVAILDKFVEANNVTVAVVSDDSDMKTACQTRPRLLSFASMTRLTELLVIGSPEIDILREAILGGIEPLHEAVLEQAANLSYYHESGAYELLESTAVSADFNDVRVVGLGLDEATLAFDANISAEHYMRWSEEDYDNEFVTYSATVLDAGEVHGVVKVMLNPQSRAIVCVVSVVMDEEELMVSEAPRHR